MKILILISIVLLSFIAVAQEQTTAQGYVSLTIEPTPQSKDNILSRTNIAVIILAVIVLFFRYVALRIMSI
ncbi:hypothetical protein HYV49_01430 [Candidatus Pacearchaeota archaeon]|nr:hypothetical protein [Candidatus Pacearchaeota archaeon]